MRYSGRMEQASSEAVRQVTAIAFPVQLSYATHGLPDPNLVGPCQSQSSPFCEPGNGRQRMDPMDMAETETAFRGYLQMCQACYDSQADLYVRYTHGRA